MSLRFRILILTGLFFAILMGIGWLGLSSINDLHKELLAKHRRTSEAELHAVMAQAGFKKQEQEWNSMLLRGHQRGEVDTFWRNFEREETSARCWAELLVEDLPSDSEALVLAKQFLDEHERLGQKYREARGVFLDGGKDMIPAVNAMLSGPDQARAFDEIIQILSADRQSMQVAAEVMKVQSLAVTALSMAGAAIASFLVLAVLLHRWVNRPVVAVMNQAEKIAKGNFEHCDAPSSSAEIVKLQRALNTMAGCLKESYDNLETANRELMIARDAALDSSRLKSEFLANVSHEMRTPLNGIIGMGELLADTPLNRDQTIMANIARSSAKTMLAVINDLLDFSKIEADKIDLHCVEFNLEELLEESVLVVAPRVDATDVALGYVMESGVPQRVWGDPVRLKQILTNLLSNASKFTEKGEISLRARVMKRGENRVHLEFLVADSGIGIPKDKLEVIFEAFRQADGTATRAQGGTGLGLAISQRLVDLMGGTIRVESEVGVGSCFMAEAWFPLGQGKSEITNSDLSLQGKRILIVDDHAFNREILTRQIQSWGCHTHSVGLASEALRVLDRVEGAKGVDLIVSDYQMPIMDGHEFAREVKARGDCRDLPIILLTSVAPGLGMSDTPEGLFAAVATKPVIKQSLYDVVTRVLKGEVGPAKAETEKKPSRIRQAPASPVRVLLVEDDRMNRKYLSMLLRKSGFEHGVAENGKVAVEALQESSYDLVLMDCSMPIMDGYEATRQIRAMMPPGGGPKIIGLTGHAGTEARQKCLAAGMDQYMSKPVEPEELLQEIDYLMAATPAM